MLRNPVRHLLCGAAVLLTGRLVYHLLIVVLTADFADGITEIGIGQPGGTLEVGVQRTHGAVTGLSIGGPVRLAQTLTVTLTDAAAAPG